MAKRTVSAKVLLPIVLQMLSITSVLAQPSLPEQNQQSASTGTVHGRISLSRRGGQHATQTPGKSSSHYASHTEHHSSLTDLPTLSDTLRLSERTAVFLEGETLAKKQYPLQEGHPVLDQKDLQFHPQVLPVLIGTTVDFPNQDNLYHNVFSYSRSKEFDLGRYPKNDSRSVRFDKPGIVRVYCDIHSHMNATVIVLEHPFFAVPLDNGEYLISKIPEGNYTLVFWLDRNEVERRPVQVRSGQSIQIDFAD
jgi:plastocyanin